MELRDLIEKFSTSPEDQYKAIFSSLFIIGNRLQTIFDHNIPEITLKQFMLLTMVKQSKEQLTFTQLGKLLGCSRQNIKKLALALEKKGFVTIQHRVDDVRASCIAPTDHFRNYFETIFVSCEKELRYLFEVYSEEEVAQLFHLFMKLYAGTDHLERKIHKKEDENSPYLDL